MPQLPEKNALPHLGEAINCHLDALFPMFSAQQLVQQACAPTQETCTGFHQMNHFNIALDTLSWLKGQANCPSDVQQAAQGVIEELARLDITLKFNRQLMVDA